ALQGPDRSIQRSYRSEDVPARQPGSQNVQAAVQKTCAGQDVKDSVVACLLARPRNGYAKFVPDVVEAICQRLNIFVTGRLDNSCFQFVPFRLHIFQLRSYRRVANVRRRAGTDTMPDLQQSRLEGRDAVQDAPKIFARRGECCQVAPQLKNDDLLAPDCAPQLI